MHGLLVAAQVLAVYSLRSGFELQPPEAWVEARDIGIGLWKEWADASENAPEDSLPNDPIPGFDVIEAAGNIRARSINLITERFGGEIIVPELWKLLHIEYNAPGPQPRNPRMRSRGTYICDIGAADGVMLIEQATEENFPEPVTIPKVLWWMWEHEVNALHQCADPSSPLDYSGLNHIIADDIYDWGTVEILDWAARYRGGELSFYPDDVDHIDPNNDFWAVLGSRRAEPIMEMLIEHKGSLRGKNINRILVYPTRYLDPAATGEPPYVMWFELA